MDERIAAAALAHIASIDLQQLSPGISGYEITIPGGGGLAPMRSEAAPKPPRFRATVIFEWEGDHPPEEVAALHERWTRGA